MSDFIVSFVIPLAYIALGVAALAAIAFPAIYMFQDLKKARTALIGVLAMVVLFLVCYAIADGTANDKATAGEMKMIEASLYTFYVMLLVSIGAIIYASVSRYFK
ncbi:MAG: hypothetical protein LBQ60_14080 [Bacteroidales bacterium]|jgi:uncharacterized membrane protein YozB (DUF420 family)|nr:hypothetical protein [Bacteroidales bacterium]